MQHQLRTRLYTTWGTVLYKDMASGELRHGPIDKSPGNLVLEAVQTGSQSTMRGRLIELEPQGDQLRAIAALEGQNGSSSDKNNVESSLNTVFNVVPLKCGLVALEFEDRFLSAEQGGNITLSVRWCRLWEFFIVSENWSKTPQEIILADSDPFGQFDVAEDQLETFSVDPRLRTKAIVEANFLNATAEPAQSTRCSPGGAYDLAQIYTKQFRIFRTIHIVWVGDQTLRPDNCIESWRQMNPDWKVKVWVNQDLGSETWQNIAHLREMASLELCGIADIMRWEILDRLGGFAVDADSICVRPIEEWLFEPEIFACWESEIARPGLIANGYVYSHPGNTLIRQVIKDIQGLPNLSGGRAWQLVGPKRLTDTYRNMAYTGMTIYPSHYFMPQHLTGISYSGSGPVFAKQLWGSTKAGTYDSLGPQKIG